MRHAASAWRGARDMCWGIEVTAGMAAVGVVAAAYTWRRGDPGVVPLTLAYFAAMEGLQFGGYLVVDECSSPANQTYAFLSILHIIFQPFIINAFALQLVPERVRARARVPVFALCFASAVVMLMQLIPFDWAGACTEGSILCGKASVHRLGRLAHRLERALQRASGAGRCGTGHALGVPDLSCRGVRGAAVLRRVAVCGLSRADRAAAGGAADPQPERDTRDLVPLFDRHCDDRGVPTGAATV